MKSSESRIVGEAPFIAQLAHRTEGVPPCADSDVH